MGVPTLEPRPQGRDRPPTKISPSILSADFARLAEECARMQQLGADWLHVDVMDGHFVPNLTIGAPVVKSLRKHHPQAFLDVHLMVSDPARWVPDFAAAGASLYCFHIEAAAAAALDGRTEADALAALAAVGGAGLPAVHALVDAVHGAGMLAGLTLKPGTPVDLLLPYIKGPGEAGGVDMVLVMTVEPGFGGQAFMPEMMDKVRSLRQRFPHLYIEVDGGLAPDTIGAAAAAGANAIVAGSAIFGAADPGAVIGQLRAAVDEAAAAAAAAAQ